MQFQQFYAILDKAYRTIGGGKQMDLFTTQHLKSLNDLEFDIYKYVQANMAKIDKMKIRELANELHCSTTTILRFCRKLDCNGYSEFKLKLKMMADGRKLVTQPESEECEVFQYFQNMNPKLDAEIREAANLVYQANRIMLMGMGTSGIMAKFGARYLTNMGKLVHYIDDPFYPVPDDFYKDFLIIVISTSGETKEMIDKVHKFKTLNALTIAITNSATSTLAKLSDFSLSYYVPIEKRTDNISVHDVTTQVPVVYLIEKLGKEVYKLIEDGKGMKI